uniref:Telomeric repeat-binding factor 2-interacting protein 1 n=1 Tax=Timema cristinae TaxID=61476 RepID=A0A7R9D8C1_TIMCR|nr:unnamed protein product [Timema cristinae]
MLKTGITVRFRSGGQFIREATKSEIWYLPMEANIDLSKISPTLFLDFTAQSLTYLLKPCKEAGLIQEIINAGNGAIVNEVGLYTITIMSPNEDYDGDEEVFSIKYIEDCARENKQLNLNNYSRRVHSTHPSPQCPSVVAQRGRLVTQPPPPPAITTHLPLTYIHNETPELPEEKILIFTDHLDQLKTDMESRFEDLTKLQIPDWILDPFLFEAVDKLDNSLQTEFLDLKLNKRSRFRPAFDVNDIQDKRLNWVTAEASWSRVEGGPQNANTNSAVPNKVSPRKLYTHNEKKAIVKYIVKNNGIDRVKGRALWEEMEEELKIGRTWQSMKEHFIKSIVPNIDSFKIPANNKLLNLWVVSALLVGPASKLTFMFGTVQRPLYSL